MGHTLTLLGNPELSGILYSCLREVSGNYIFYFCPSEKSAYFSEIRDPRIRTAPVCTDFDNFLPKNPGRTRSKPSLVALGVHLMTFTFFPRFFRDVKLNKTFILFRTIVFFACARLMEALYKNYKHYEFEILGDFLKFYVNSVDKNIFF